MPYRQNNYQFVIDSSFKPFSFSEMLQPWAIYSNAYEKAEEEYNNLSKLERFRELVNKEGEEDAARIYNAYAEEYDKQYKDFAQNGLNIGNRRGLTNLKRRYQGEIGRLERAEEKLNAEQKNRDALRAKGIQMFYEKDNLRLSDYLDGNTPELYGISAEDLYTKGAAAGKAFTSRLFESGDGGSVMNGYYRRWVESQGLDPDKLNKFQQEMMINGFKNAASSIPELQQLAVSGLEGLGVYNHLRGNNLRQAELNYLNGVIDGAIYKVDAKPIEDKSKMTPYQQAQLAQSRMSTMLSGALYGKRWDGKQWVDDGSMENVKGKSSSTSTSSSGSSGSSRKAAGSNKLTQSADRLKISWRGNNPNDTNEDADNDYEITTVEKSEPSHPGRRVNYEQLPAYAKSIADEIIGDGNADLYDFYFQPYESGWNDTEAELEVVPRDIKDFKQPESLDPSIFGNY